MSQKSVLEMEGDEKVKLSLVFYC